MGLLQKQQRREAKTKRQPSDFAQLLPPTMAVASLGRPMLRHCPLRQPSSCHFLLELRLTKKRSSTPRFGLGLSFRDDGQFLPLQPGQLPSNMAVTVVLCLPIPLRSPTTMFYHLLL
jgi:hypothetical protein